MIQAPIFHVNGDDPEACVRVARIAFEFRQAFHKDVVIDLVCYRLRGHNEGDDPSMTQPLMYGLIDAKRSVRKLYTASLIGRGDITVEEAEEDPETTTVDEGAADEGEESAEAAASEQKRPEHLEDGPYDEADAPEEDRSDLGGLRVPTIDGMERRMEVDQRSSAFIAHGK